MAFIPAPETAQVQVTATKDGLPLENVFNVQKDGGWSSGTLTNLVTVFREYWEDNAPTLMPNDLVFNQVIATDISEQISIQEEANFTGGTVGTLGGQPMPNHVSKLCTLSTGLRGRSARGGIHWLGFSENVVQSNTIDSSYLNSMDSFLTGLLNYVSTNTGGSIVVVSRQFNNAPRLVAALFVVQGISFANARVGSMRGRLT